MEQPSLPQVFSHPHFLSFERCQELIDTIKQAPTHSTTVATHGTPQVKDDIRRTSRVEVSDRPIADVARQLQDIMPTLQSHFGITITITQPIQVLRYQPGDFYKIHKDNGNLRVQEVGAAVPARIANRKLTAVVFLNGQEDSLDREPFVGGDLVLHTKISLTDSEDSPLSIEAKPGLLVAFPASTLHEVRPVVSGVRYSIVNWFE